MAEKSDFGTFGRYREVPVGEMPADMRDAYETTMRLRGQVPGPHKIRPGTKLAKLTTIALFPVKSFLENLAVRSDNSVLVTSMNDKELFYVSPSSGAAPVEPVLLHRFDQPTTGLVEVEPDLFLVSTSNLYTTHESYLQRLDLRDWQPGTPAPMETVFRFPDTAQWLNGRCLLAPGVVLIADCFAGLIWRLDVQPGTRDMQARVWLAHGSMGYFPGKLRPEQLGVNGVRYAARPRYLYSTSTAKKLLMRVPVEPTTFEPAGAPELVAAGRMGDDYCIDEDVGVIYLATHRQNTIDRVSMDPGDNSGFPQSVAGDPFTEALIGAVQRRLEPGRRRLRQDCLFHQRRRHRISSAKRAAPGEAATRGVLTRPNSLLTESGSGGA